MFLMNLIINLENMKKTIVYIVEKIVPLLPFEIIAHNLETEL